jgi:hypothetical protein
MAQKIHFSKILESNGGNVSTLYTIEPSINLNNYPDLLYADFLGHWVVDSCRCGGKFNQYASLLTEVIGCDELNHLLITTFDILIQVNKPDNIVMIETKKIQTIIGCNRAFAHNYWWISLQDATDLGFTTTRTYAEFIDDLV